ncbi:hypothetical protein P154DRAFT_248963 [Amniculicola lignicola CBS 123094]|uniref:Uncharacterized protein n=1 Tax=Amniculicola lignicola CBS 123094 TaxID=1392246 RepID=A0A6A5WLP2_9PLEO|nr:hypothetical protein P154DRAFT_248963 [Amniculicola lignicola CBS 123094]
MGAGWFVLRHLGPLMLGEVEHFGSLARCDHVPRGLCRTTVPSTSRLSPYTSNWPMESTLWPCSSTQDGGSRRTSLGRHSEPRTTLVHFGQVLCNASASPRLGRLSSMPVGPRCFFLLPKFGVLGSREIHGSIHPMSPSSNSTEAAPITPLFPRHPCRRPSADTIFANPPRLARGIVGQSPYLLMLQHAVRASHSVILYRHLCGSLGSTACILHCTSTLVSIQLINFPRNGSFIPHPTYC